MTTALQFLLPDVGEGLTEAEIVTWHVAVGDIVEVNQLIVEIETAKSIVELPCPYAGTVVRLHAQRGDSVDVGLPIITVDTASATTSPAAEAPSRESEAEPRLLVGYGPRDHGDGRRRRRRVESHTVSETPLLPHTPDLSPPRKPAAKPPVRKLAKDIGVDLAAIEATGPDGTVSREDVLRASESPPAEKGGWSEGASSDVVDGVLRIPVRGVRKFTAAAVTASAFTAPHVTEFVTVDMSRTVELRARISARREFSGIKLTPLAFVARALLIALARTPEGNSRWDQEAQEIVQMREVNLGIAAATPRGLIVPNIKGAQRMLLSELAVAISSLADVARTGKTSPADQAGGTITITNIGVFGVDTGTPILHSGEAAILAFGAIRRTPWVVGEGVDERIEPRWTTQLALSFDHRVMDGQQGSELLAHVASVLNEPGLAVL